MLQQTQVATVIPYYERWMKSFPTVEALAATPLPKVLKAWEGLGYYRRARFLHEGAGVIVRERKGSFPTTREGLQELPGIGPYASAAIASLAYGLPHAVLDGNVERVLLRLTADRRPLDEKGMKAHLTSLADSFLDARHPGAFNEAMMELGATVCTPSNPNCAKCPVNSGCRAHETDQADKIPTAQTRMGQVNRVNHFCVVSNQGRVLLAKPQAKGRLQGLWTFPIRNQDPPGPKWEKPAFSIRHGIVNERHDSRFYLVKFAKSMTPIPHTTWQTLSSASALPMPIAHRKAFRALFPTPVPFP